MVKIGDNIIDDSGEATGVVVAILHPGYFATTQGPYLVDRWNELYPNWEQHDVVYSLLLEPQKHWSETEANDWPCISQWQDQSVKDMIYKCSPYVTELSIPLHRVNTAPTNIYEYRWNINDRIVYDGQHTGTVVGLYDPFWFTSRNGANPEWDIKYSGWNYNPLVCISLDQPIKSPYSNHQNLPEYFSKMRQAMMPVQSVVVAPSSSIVRGPNCE